ncbi:MAG: patatin-like phospholipase family protein [Robiginitomaculum sp.]|nr:patatin-like phospholipase family protein [Robiginitomaculum sp.]
MRGVLALFLLALALPAFGQAVQRETNIRPKIGLVLGGGGALGLSHVGVIQRLEEEGIFADIVVGTSIGAVVGATYTSGYSGPELSVLVDDLDWKNMFVDASHRSRLNFRRKQDDVDFPIRLKIGIDQDGLKLPRGAIEGQKLYFELTRLINARNPGARFSNLNRPFKAIATNLENKQTVVLSDGDLTRAVFASMAVPGLLAPVQIGDRLLVDGGLANNLPVSIARAMGADIIIAVDLSRPLKTADEIGNVFDVVEQIVNFVTLQQTEIEIDNLSEVDILVRPDLSGFSPAGFERGRELITVGRDAINAVLPQIRTLVETMQASEPAPVVLANLANPRIAAIHLDNQTNTADALIWANLTAKAGEIFDEEKLAKDITDLYGYDLFGRVDYRLEERADGTHLHLSLQEQSVGDDFLRFGFSVQSNFENEGTFSAQASFTRRNLNTLGAEWRSVLRIGNSPAFGTEWYQPLDARQTWFVSAGADIGRTNFSLFDADNISIGQLRLDQLSVNAALGKTLGRFGEIRVGANHSWNSIERSVGFVGFADQRISSTDVFASLQIDTFDSLAFPSSGWSGNLVIDASVAGDFDAFEDRTLSFSLSRVFPFAGGNLLPRIQAGLALDEPVDGIGEQSLGGFLNLSGLAPSSRLGNHSALASLVWYRPITAPTGLISYPLYLGFSLEAGNVFDRLDDIRLANFTTAGSIFLGAPTPIGPVYLAGGVTEDGNTSVYLFVGQTF